MECRIKIRIISKKIELTLDITNSGNEMRSDGIELWKCTGEEGVDMMWYLTQMIYEQEKIPVRPAS